MLPAVPRGVPLRRSLVREICELLDFEAVADVAELLASEIVTNAVLHPSTDQVAVVVEARHGELVVSVTDGDRRPPALRQPTPEALGGRGMLLLDSLAEQWGVTELPEGKAVWFTLSNKACHAMAGKDRHPARPSD